MMRALTMAGVALAGGLCLSAQATRPFPGTLDEHPAIGYAERLTTDRVTRLNESIDAGAVTLRPEGATALLRPVLRALDISEASQVLVFSKSGLQREYTGPANPRALYFNDSVVVGYIAGAPVLEVASHDPRQGTQFFTLEPSTSGAAPTFVRNHACLTCHLAASTAEVPGFIARSHVVGEDGRLMPRLGSFDVDHRTPHTERWGGWFVTGSAAAPPYGPLGHLGNVTVTSHPTSGPVILSDRVLVEWLDRAPLARAYLSPESDLAALMTFDHQMHGLNLLTRLNWDARIAAADGSTTGLDARIGELVDYLLFVDEAPLAFTVEPRPGFVEAVAARYPRDRQGRSLAEYDLTRRLLKYGCSYLIYSDAFRALPDPVRRRVYDRMFDVLDGRPTDPRYGHLSPADRLAIIGVLDDTIPEFSRGPRAQLENAGS